jgi:predicted TIM-barrel fold metal-dependent hydrolase
VFADAVAKGDPRTTLLYFDVTGVALTPKMTPEEAALFVRRIRQLGVQRILYGTDAAAGGNPPPREAWAAFRKLGLTDDEIRTIAANAPPYMK